jgi:hypothetical protein
VSNGQEILNDIELEEKIRDPRWTNDDKINFLVRCQFRQSREIMEIKINCARACELPPLGRKQTYFNASGLAAFFLSIIIGLLEWIQYKS